MGSSSMDGIDGTIDGRRQGERTTEKRRDGRPAGMFRRPRIRDPSCKFIASQNTRRDEYAHRYTHCFDIL